MRRREIKFRAWDGSRMQTVLTLGLYEGFVSTNKLHSDIEDFILMQYIGLLDKNGKEIYEGDIVNTVYNGMLFTGIVVYDESELGFKATNGEVNYGSNFQYLSCCEEIEVIGNIYDNQELVKMII